MKVLEKEFETVGKCSPRTIWPRNCHENVKSALDISYMYYIYSTMLNLLSTFSSYASSFYQIKNLKILICHWIHKLWVKKS
jgi:hypothetical protein